MRRLRHDSTDLIARAIQPALWLLLFGEVFTRVRAISPGDVPYRISWRRVFSPRACSLSRSFMASASSGSGPGNRSQIFSEPHAARCSGSREGSVGGRSDSLFKRSSFIFWRCLLGVQMNWSPHGAPWRAGKRHPWRGNVFDRLVNSRLAGEDPRKIYGNGTGARPCRYFFASNAI